MSPLIAAALVTALTAVAVALLRRTRALGDEVASLSSRVDELSARVVAAEQDLAQATTTADVAETLLVEKGIADVEEVEDARRRFSSSSGAPPEPAAPREGELH